METVESKVEYISIKLRFLEFFFSLHLHDLQCLKILTAAFKFEHLQTSFDRTKQTQKFSFALCFFFIIL